MTPSAWSIGPGSPRPAPITRERSTPASAERLVDQLDRDVEPLLRGVVGVQRLARARRRIVRREVADRDAHVAVAEVDAERRAGGRVERQQDRRAAALLAVRGAGLLPLDDEPVGLQLADEARDGRAREAGAARDLGAADRPVLAQRVDHAPAIEPAQRRQRALGPLPQGRDPDRALSRARRTYPKPPNARPRTNWRVDGRRRRPFCQGLERTFIRTPQTTCGVRTNYIYINRPPWPAGSPARRARRPRCRGRRARGRPRR